MLRTDNMQDAMNSMAMLPCERGYDPRSEFNVTFAVKFYFEADRDGTADERQTRAALWRSANQLYGAISEKLKLRDLPFGNLRPFMYAQVANDNSAVGFMEPRLTVIWLFRGLGVLDFLSELTRIDLKHHGLLARGGCPANFGSHDDVLEFVHTELNSLGDHSVVCLPKYRCHRSEANPVEFLDWFTTPDDEFVAH